MTLAADALLKEECGTIAALIAAHARERPAATALIQDGDRLDYAGLDRLVDRVAAALQRDGLSPGDIVAICAKTSIAYAAVFLGALRAGVAVAPLAPSSTPRAIASMVADCDAKLFFLDETVARELAAVELPARVERVALDGSANGRPFETWLAPADAAPAPVSVDPERAFNIIYSSGTTGEPKGIVHSYAMRWLQLTRAASNGYGAASVTIVSTPLYSNTTLVSFLPTLGYGGTAVLMEKFDAVGFLQLAEKHRATHAMLVPVQYRRIMAVPDFDRYDLYELRHEAVDQRAVRGQRQGRRAEALARGPHRVLRPDRRRRHLRAGRPSPSRQASHRRPAGAGPRHSPHRRGRQGSAAGRDRRDRRALGRDHERILQAPRADRRGGMARRRAASVSSAAATSAASTPMAFSS